MSIDYNALIARSKCLMCVPEPTLLVLMVRLLSDILLLKSPMADVSVSALLQRAGPFMPLTDHQLLAIAVDLLTNVAVSVDNSYVAGAASLSTSAYYEGKMAYLLYLDEIGDKMGGHFYYDDLSMEVHDGIDVIKPADKSDLDAGRWLRSPNAT